MIEVEWMDRLFVLGNGFDLAHGLKTSYEHFKSYLLDRIKYAPMYPNIIPSNYDEEVSLIIDMISHSSEGGLWKDIESAVGNIYGAVDYYISDSMDFDERRWYGMIMCECLELIPNLFSQWVDGINIDVVTLNPKFIELFNITNTAYLTFNYTTVLEDKYKLPNVCHIHGRQKEGIIFGHGQSLTAGKEFLLKEDLECGIEYVWSDLNKNAKKQIQKNSVFFNQLTALKEVYTYGFSFSEPDIPYIQEICLRTSKETVWFFSAYEDELTRKSFEKIVRKNGFEGELRVFSA